MEEDGIFEFARVGSSIDGELIQIPKAGKCEEEKRGRRKRKIEKIRKMGYQGTSKRKIDS